MALIWAIYQVGIDRAVRKDLSWNYPAATSPNLVESAKKYKRTIWDELRARFPDGKVLHWYGTPRLSHLLQQEVGQEAVGAILSSDLF